MKGPLKKFRCPLCGSLLSQSRYYEIIGIWEERSKLERTLKEQLSELKKEKQKLLEEKNKIKIQMQKELKKAVQEAIKKGREKEKARAERLSKMIELKTQEIQRMNKKIKELQEQLKKGTTPQIEGLNLEEELIVQLKREFPQDKIFHLGKKGDIIHYIQFRNKQIGSILYECKKTNTFSNSFVAQIKKAMGERKATYGVLVTTASRKNTAGFWVEKDILIVHPYGAIYIAKVLRRSIIEIHSLKITKSEMERRTKELMEYIRSDDFKNTVEDTIYRTKTLYEMLKKEIKAHRKTWEDRYLHYKSIYNNTNRLELVTTSILKGVPKKEALAKLEVRQLEPPEKVV